MPLEQYGWHGAILGLCIWILKHVRSINITMKNGKPKGD